TGKTAAFLLPIIQRITENSASRSNPTTPKGAARGSQLSKVRVLVVAPTRELAAQIEKNYAELNTVKGNRSVTLIGGASMPRQLDALRKGPAVVIATPGRLLDLTERRAIDLSAVEVLVLDEAD